MNRQEMYHEIQVLKDLNKTQGEYIRQIQDELATLAKNENT